MTAATVLIAELGDVKRFSQPRQLMGFLGLIPRENTTGQTRRLGSITKAGNAHARWILIEAASPRLSPTEGFTPIGAAPGWPIRALQGALMEGTVAPAQARLAPD